MRHECPFEKAVARMNNIAFFGELIIGKSHGPQDEKPKGAGFKANYYDVASGNEYWI
jgi:hypothetical protein